MFLGNTQLAGAKWARRTLSSKLEDLYLVASDRRCVIKDWWPFLLSASIVSSLSL